MSTPQLKRIPEVKEKPTGKTTKEKVETTYTNELIIGICSPIGSLKNEVVGELTKMLSTEYLYEIETIKLSGFIASGYDIKYKKEEGVSEGYSKLKYKIEGGNYLRKKYNSNSILVELAIHKIRTDRNELNPENIEGKRKCYIIDSLKNIEEVELLRSVYRELFYQFGIFSPEKEREKKLSEKKNLTLTDIEDLINTDDSEDTIYGQNVRGTFVESDFFVRISNCNKTKIKEKIERYLHLIFNSKIITPSKDETAMYQAKSASVNSSCLSRQVGASISDKEGNTIAIGWNDVPKYGGNLYGGNDKCDHRCKEIGYCKNVTQKNSIINNIIQEVEEIYGIENKNSEKEIKDGQLRIVTKEEEIAAKIRAILKNSRFNYIIEYSRAIHAEMHAIILGSQLSGSKMVGGKLYCTTYPCHNCARHIILAGISKVYYIEPYPKSLGLELHHDALTEDERVKDKVNILLYDGVSPRKYLDFFSMKSDDRKDKDGKLVTRENKTSVPKNRISLKAIPELENQAIHALEESGLLKIIMTGNHETV